MQRAVEASGDLRTSSDLMPLSVRDASSALEAVALLKAELADVKDDLTGLTAEIKKLRTDIESQSKSST